MASSGRVALEQPEHRLSRLKGVLDQLKIHPASLDSYPSIFHVFSREQFDECPHHLAAQSFSGRKVSPTGSPPCRPTSAAPITCWRRCAEFPQPKCKFYFQRAPAEMFGKVRETPQRESTPFHPRSPYGISKCAGLSTVHELPRGV